MLISLAVTILLSLSQGTEHRPAKQAAQSKAIQPATPVAPAISVTVAGPTPSEEEKAREAKHRQDEVDAQVTVAAFTRSLFWVGVLQLVATGFAVYGAIRAANAAKTSADSLIFLHRAQLDCRNWEANVEWRTGNTPGYTDGANANFHFDITNVGKTSMRIENIVACLQVMGPIVRFARLPRRNDAVLSPDQSWPVDTMPIIWTGDDERLFRTTGIAVYVWGCVYFTDRAGKERWKRFGRRFFCRDGHAAFITPITRPGFNAEEDWAHAGQDDDKHYQTQDWTYQVGVD
jgi:hypothetical protein